MVFILSLNSTGTPILDYLQKRTMHYTGGRLYPVRYSKVASVCSTGLSWAAFVDAQAIELATIATADSTMKSGG